MNLRELLIDIIDDAARIGGGTDEIAAAILDDPRITVTLAPSRRDAANPTLIRLCRCEHIQSLHDAGENRCRGTVFLGIPCWCESFRDEEHTRQEARP